MATLRNYDWGDRKRKIDDWNIVEAEKRALKEYVNDFMSGGDSEKQGKNPAGNICTRLDSLKLVLEHLCKKEALFTLDPLKIIEYKKALILGKIKKGVYKKVNGKRKWVETENYSPGGIQKKMLFLTNYLAFRFRPDEKYLFEDEDARPETEKTKERKLKNLSKKLLFRPKQVKKEWILNDEIVEKLLLRANTEWKMDYLMTQKAIGRRIGELLQMKIGDLTSPKEKDGTVHFSVPATNSKTKEVENAPVFYTDSRDYLVKSIKDKKDVGLKDKDLFIDKSEDAIKTWLRREGQALLGKNIRNKDFRDYAATRITKDKKITSKFDLCDYFSWEYSSPMPDKYIGRGVDWEKKVKEASKPEITKLTDELKQAKEDRLLQQERFESDRLREKAGRKKEFAELRELFARFQRGEVVYDTDTKEYIKN